MGSGVELLTEVPGSRVVVLAPHMDDETVGCGGLIRKMTESRKDVRVLFMTDGRQGDRRLAELSGAEQVAHQAELVATRKKRPSAHAVSWVCRRSIFG
ncbi:MAG: PIG-L family deacetylase [Nitrospiraceae bacterium]